MPIALKIKRFKGRNQVKGSQYLNLKIQWPDTKIQWQHPLPNSINNLVG
jgi:hypothetical protein